MIILVDNSEIITNFVNRKNQTDYRAMSQVIHEIFPKRLQQARKMRGLSLDNLSKEMNQIVSRQVENPGGGDHVTRVRLTPWPFLGLTIDN